MARLMPTTRGEMLPARPQTLWGWPAVVNFVLGGLGAGWYIVALLAAGLERSPGVALASWTAPLLVLAGFTAVAREAGEKLVGQLVRQLAQLDVGDLDRAPGVAELRDDRRREALGEERRRRRGRQARGDDDERGHAPTSTASSARCPVALSPSA